MKNQKGLITVADALLILAIFFTIVAIGVFVFRILNGNRSESELEILYADRIITGRIESVDTGLLYTTLYFDEGLTCVITTESFSYWNNKYGRDLRSVGHVFKFAGVDTTDGNGDGYRVFRLISIDNDTLLGERSDKDGKTNGD